MEDNNGDGCTKTENSNDSPDGQNVLDCGMANNLSNYVRHTNGEQPNCYTVLSMLIDYTSIRYN